MYLLTFEASEVEDVMDNFLWMHLSKNTFSRILPIVVVCLSVSLCVNLYMLWLHAYEVLRVMIWIKLKMCTKTASPSRSYLTKPRCRDTSRHLESNYTVRCRIAYWIIELFYLFISLGKGKSSTVSIYSFVFAFFFFFFCRPIVSYVHCQL